MIRPKKGLWHCVLQGGGNWVGEWVVKLGGEGGKVWGDKWGGVGWGGDWDGVGAGVGWVKEFIKQHTKEPFSTKEIETVRRANIFGEITISHTLSFRLCVFQTSILIRRVRSGVDWI